MDGAGGAGFPSHVKAGSSVEYVIANGAECEPLLHKDFELMVHYPERVVDGVSLLMQATGARALESSASRRRIDARSKR